MRVEVYADAAQAGEPLVCQMTPIAAIPNVLNASIYRVTIETARPAGDFTVRVVPFHPEARVPLENPLIAWQC